jgi:tetratricopeptide (TPR) repeat protein
MSLPLELSGAHNAALDLLERAHQEREHHNPASAQYLYKAALELLCSLSPYQDVGKDIATTMVWIGLVMREQYEYDESTLMLNRALVKMFEAYGGDSAKSHDIFWAIMFLSRSYAEQGNLEGAIEFGERGLVMFYALYDRDQHPPQLEIGLLRHLAKMKRDIGQEKEYEELMEMVAFTEMDISRKNRFP